MLWEGALLTLGRWGPVPATGSSLAPLHCSKHEMSPCPPVPRTRGCQHCLHSQAGAFPARGAWQGSGQDCRLPVLPHPQRARSRCPLSWHKSSQGPPGRCPSPALPSSQVKSNASPGARAAAVSPWGHLALSHGQHVPCVQGGPLGDDTAALWAAGAAPAAATAPGSPSLLALAWLLQGHGVEGGG